MINETTQALTETSPTLFSLTSKITFDQALKVTTSINFWLPIAILLILPIFVYLLWGLCSKARSPLTGRTMDARVASTYNFWIGFAILFCFNLVAFILIIFPIWLQLLD